MKKILLVISIITFIFHSSKVWAQTIPNTAAVSTTPYTSFYAQAGLGSDNTSFEVANPVRELFAQAITNAYKINTTSQVPVITTGPVTGVIVANAGEASTAVQQFTVTASGLSDNVVATSPNYFEIATNPNGPFSYDVTLPQSGGSINAVLYLRVNGAQCGIITGDVALIATDASASATVSASINQVVTASEQTSFISFSNCTYSWTNNHPEIGIPASGTGDIASFTAKNLTSVPIIATITATTAPGCTGPPGSFTITVNPAPGPPSLALVSARHQAPITDQLYATYGTVTAAGVSIASGTNMQNAIYFTVTGNFEIAQYSTWGNTVTMDADFINRAAVSGGAITPGISVRVSPTTPVGNYTGTLTVSSTGMPTLVYTLSATVNKAPLTIKANDVVKNIGAVLTNTTTSTAITPTGLQNGETISSASLSYGAGAAANAATGTYNDAITPSAAIGGNGFLPGNYAITYANGNITVIRGVITVKANNVDKIYGTNLTGGSGSNAVTVTGLPVNEIAGTATITYGAGSAVADAVGTYSGSIIPSNLTGGSFNPAYYTINYLPGDINVTVPPPTLGIDPIHHAVPIETPPATTYGTASGIGQVYLVATNLKDDVTITAPENFEVKFGGSPFARTITIPKENINSYELLNTLAMRLTATAPAGTYTGDLVISSPGAQPYTVRVTGTVNPAPLTITLNNVSKTYGSTLSNGISTIAFTATGLQNGNTLAVDMNYNLGTNGSLPVGTYNGIIGSNGVTGANGFLASNYNITIVPGNMVVTKASLTIEALPVTKPYGTVATYDGIFNVKFIGLQNHEGRSGGGTLTYNGPGALANAATGTYPNAVTPSNPMPDGIFSPDNYDITYLSAALVVTAAPLTVMANNVTKTFGTQLNDEPNSTAFTATGLLNGDVIPDVSITYQHGGLAADGAGSYSGTVIPLANNGGSFSAANYIITYVPGNLTVNKAAITITANNVNKVYGTVLSNNPASSAFTITGGALQNGNTLSADIAYGTGAAANAPAGTYTGSVTITGTSGANGFLSTNYTITYLPGNIIVGGAPLTITANNISKTYGATLTGGANSTAYTITGGSLLNGNTLSSVTIAYGTGAAPADAMGTYNGQVIPSAAVGGNGFLSSNYHITYVPGTITVGRAVLTITPNDETKMQTTVLTSGPGKLNFTTTGLQNNETIGSITLTYGTGAAALAPVGTYNGQVVPSAPAGGTFNASNYSVVYNPAAIIVTPIPPPVITVTGNISAMTATYGSASTTTYNFNVSGVFMTAGILVTPPPGYEVSLDNATFSPTVTVGTAGTIAPTPVYIRLAKNAGAGTYSGNIVLSSPGATNVNVATDASVVAALPLTIATSNVSKPYGDVLSATAGSTAFTLTAGTLQNGNIISSVSLAYGVGSAATDGVRAYTGSVTPSAAVGTNGFAAANYNITYTPANLVVTPAQLTISATDIQKTYGATITGAPGSTAFSSIGLKNNETIGSVTIADGSGSAATDAVGTYPASVTPSTAIGGTFAAANYTITYSPGKIIVSPAPLTITANNAGKVYGTGLTTSSGSTAFTSSGLQNGENIGNVTLTYGTGGEATAAVGSYAGSVKPSAPAGGTFTAGNYNITYTAGNLAVSAAPLTITANNTHKTYGSALADATGSNAFAITGGALLNGNTITSVNLAYGLGSAATAAVGSYPGSVKPSAATGSNGFMAGNYQITYTAGDIIVDPAALTVTANNLVKVYGNALTGGGPGSAAFTATGLQNSETIGSVTITYTAGAAATAAVGSYPGTIIPSAATGGSFLLTNYTVTYTPGNLTIDPPPRPFIIANGNLPAFNTTYGTASTAASFTVAGANMVAGILVTAPNGFEVSIDNATFTPALTFGGVGSVLNTPVYIRLAAVTPAGTYAGNVVLSSSGAANVPVNVSLSTVNAAPLSITANEVTKTYGTPLTGGASMAFNVSGLKNNEAINSLQISYGLGTDAATAAAGTYTGAVIPSAPLVGTGGFLAANYRITYIPGNVTVNPASLTITANRVSKNYGTTLTGGDGSTAFVITAGSLQNGDIINSVHIAYGSGALSTATAGTYTSAVAPSAAVGSNGFLSGNYIITYAAGAMDVLPVRLTVTADNQVKDFGTDNPVLSLTYSGFVNGETPADLTRLPFASTTAMKRSPIGQYPILVGDAASPNYVFTYIPGTLTISAEHIVLGIPNAITPNGDGINDTWNIKNLDAYPNTTVDIFDRYGRKVFSSIGYGVAWDGSYQGASLPTGTYYYIINPKNNAKTVAGSVTIIR